MYLLHLTDEERDAVAYLRKVLNVDRDDPAGPAGRPPRLLQSLAAAAAAAVARGPFSDEDLAELGRSALRRDYYDGVRRIAEDAVSEAFDSLEPDDEPDEDDLRESVDESVDQSVDGSAWVIYIGNAMDVLRVSDNDGAGPDELGADGFDWSAGVPWSQLAYFAMRADVYEVVWDLFEERLEEAREAHDAAMLAEEQDGEEVPQ